MSNKALHLTPPPLPATVADLEAQRVIKKKPNRNDAVEEIFKALWKDKRFPQLQFGLEGGKKSQFLEGSRDADDFAAVRMIKDYAEEKHIALVEKADWTTIRKSLRTVRKRYKMSRRQRVNVAAGQDGDAAAAAAE